MGTDGDVEGSANSQCSRALAAAWGILPVRYSRYSVHSLLWVSGINPLSGFRLSKKGRMKHCTDYFETGVHHFGLDVLRTAPAVKSDRKRTPVYLK